MIYLICRAKNELDIIMALKSYRYVKSGKCIREINYVGFELTKYRNLSLLSNSALLLTANREQKRKVSRNDYIGLFIRR